ncbi:MAG: hypothetical protein ACREDR_48790, partial [Blastocatellia bacterium]
IQALQRIGDPAVPLTVDRLFSAAQEERLLSIIRSPSLAETGRLRFVWVIEIRLCTVLELTGDAGLLTTLQVLADSDGTPWASECARKLIRKFKPRF